MKATLGRHVVADSADLVEVDGYQYFPRAAVRTEWLQKSPKTANDQLCPHGVQFYDVVVDGRRHERAAWCYEAPQKSMQRVAGRFGFWEDVEVG